MASPGSRDHLRALEFYAGVGGFHYALRRSGVNAVVIGSIDINTTANKVYQHNFPNTAHLNRNICGLTAAELDKLEPDLLHMSPPCQPFTRQGLRRDSKDRRTDSFFHLMLILGEMQRAPRYIIMENVQGFESSHTRAEFTAILRKIGYAYQEFLLSPNQFGVPNSRLRYYLLAKKKTLVFAMDPKEQPCRDAQALLECVAAIPAATHLQHPSTFHTTTHSSAHGRRSGEDGKERDTLSSQEEEAQLVCVTSPLLQMTSPSVPSSSSPPPSSPHPSPLSPLTSSSCASSSSSQRPSPSPPLPPISTFLQPLTEDQLQSYLVPANILKKYAVALDIVQPSSTHSCCFTRGYGSYAVGTGSVLQHASEEDMHAAFREFTGKQKKEELEGAAQSLAPLKLRYFTPREVANLMCFPPEFSIPPSVTVRQSYKVLGNSLNVLVVSVLLRYLVHEHLHVPV